MNEHTKIDVSLDCYGASGGRPSIGSVNLFQSQISHGRGLSDELDREKKAILGSGAVS